MAKLRFDLAADAISVLQKYIDTDSEHGNTLSILQAAEKALNDLVKIERKIVQKHSEKKEKQSDVLTALMEVENRIDLTREHLEPVTDFIVTYRPEILAMKEIVLKMQELTAVVNLMRSIDKQLTDVRHRITIV